MNIIVAGLPTAKTQRTVSIVKEALKLLTLRAKVECIYDPVEMRKLGVTRTPTVVLNTEVKAAGRIPSIFEVERWIEAGDPVTES
jgi:hypothetical protein